MSRDCIGHVQLCNYGNDVGHRTHDAHRARAGEISVRLGSDPTLLNSYVYMSKQIICYESLMF